MGTAIAIALLVVGGAIVYIGWTGSYAKAWKVITHPRVP